MKICKDYNQKIINFERLMESSMKDELVIKHVRLTFDEWNRSIRKKTIYLSEDEEQCYALINIDQVKEPQVWEVFNSRSVVANDGYKWLVTAPKNENYVITMYMDENDKPILWYIDMIDGQGVDEDGVNYYNDIFLDLLVSEKRQVVEDDRDELEKALVYGIINQKQYQQANVTAEKLKQKIEEYPNWILEYCQEVLEKIQKEIMEEKCKIYN